ncbi:hypothetical protein Pcinc_039550 [Petrolisthes cinctipes]|uniref:Uncharacterized protein n=1 Tax=Petrolisthes cinctipes TaxID=88211 RepID=A0AAE1BP15_PETCI|nr:hypothetical protein Pcinc_039550 [Petrolisthes cinctipes]
MDLDAIKVLLDSQAKAFHTAMDFVAEQFKSRIQEAEATIQDLSRSLEFTQADVKDLQNEVKELRKLQSESVAPNDVLKSQVKDLEHRLNYQEDYSRRNNLRISGIVEKPGETWEETAISVSKLIEEKLQLPAVKLERAHRTGPVSSSRPRIVTARFEKFHEREAVMRNARKLKGSNIYIDEDLCPTSQEIRKSQIPLMKKARAEGKIAFFKHTRLIIKDKSDNYQSQDSSRNEGVSTHEAKSDVTEAVDRTGASDGKQPDDSIRGAVGESPAEPLTGVWARNARTRSRKKQ